MAGDREKPVEIFSAKKIKVNTLDDISGGSLIIDASIGIASGKNITLNSGNIITDTSTGTKLGIATNQKLGFWDATPVIQFATTGETAGHSAVGGTNVNASDTFTGNNGTRAYTINDIVKALKACGIMDVSS